MTTITARCEFPGHDQVVKESGVHGVAGHYGSGTTVVTDTCREMVITVENLLKEIASTGEVRMTSLEDLDIYLAKVKEVLLRVLHEQGVIIIRGR